MGTYNSLIGMATVVGSILSGYIVVNFGYSVCFGAGAVLTSFTAACLWWLGATIPTQAN